VGECFFWYRLTRVVPDKIHRAVKRLCVCVCVYLGEPVHDEHSPTHTYPDQSHFICFLHLLLSMASSLFDLHAWQSCCTTSVQVFFGLPLGLNFETLHFILHTFLHSIIVFFLQHMPIPSQPVLLEYQIIQQIQQQLLCLVKRTLFISSGSAIVCIISGFFCHMQPIFMKSY